jgi:hypothetical protein
MDQTGTTRSNLPSLRDFLMFERAVTRYRNLNGAERVRDMVPTAFIDALEGRYYTLSQTEDGEEYDKILFRSILMRMSPFDRADAEAQAGRIRMPDATLPIADNVLAYNQEFGMFMRLLPNMPDHDQMDQKKLGKLYVAGLKPHQFKKRIDNIREDTKSITVADLMDEARNEAMTTEQRAMGMRPYLPTANKDTTTTTTTTKKGTATGNPKWVCKVSSCSKTCSLNKVTNSRYDYCSKACTNAAKSTSANKPSQAAATDNFKKRKPTPSDKGGGGPLCARKSCQYPAATRSDGSFHAHCSATCHAANTNALGPNASTPSTRGTTSTPSAKGTCFRCGEAGHKVSNCPMPTIRELHTQQFSTPTMLHSPFMPTDAAMQAQQYMQTQQQQQPSSQLMQLTQPAQPSARPPMASAFPQYQQTGPPTIGHGGWSPPSSVGSAPSTTSLMQLQSENSDLRRQLDLSRTSLSNTSTSQGLPFHSGY